MDDEWWPLDVCCETEVQDVFDLFDFWDGRDSMVDAYKVGDFLRCCGLNPTQALVLANGGSATVGKSRSIAASYY